MIKVPSFLVLFCVLMRALALKTTMVAAKTATQLIEQKVNNNSFHAAEIGLKKKYMSSIADTAMKRATSYVRNQKKDFRWNSSTNIGLNLLKSPRYKNFTVWKAAPIFHRIGWNTSVEKRYEDRGASPVISPHHAIHVKGDIALGAKPQSAAKSSSTLAVDSGRVSATNRLTHSVSNINKTLVAKQNRIPLRSTGLHADMRFARSSNYASNKNKEKMFENGKGGISHKPFPFGGRGYKYSPSQYKHPPHHHHHHHHHHHRVYSIAHMERIHPQLLLSLD